MRIAFPILGLTLLIITGTFPCLGQEPKNDSSPKAAVPPDRKEDEKAIRAADDAFVKAYNAGDSKAIANLFTEDAEAVDEEGDTVEGREAIGAVFASIFEEHPGSKIELAVDSIRFLGGDLAIENGHSKVTSASGGSPEFGRFTVFYLKRDGQWLQAHVREHMEKHVSHHERLKDLEWMIGNWVEEDSHSVVTNTCRWSEDKNYLLRNFSIRIEGKVVLSGTQRIGWDPASRQIRSWVFDNDGGFGEGLWTKSDNQWTIRTHCVRPGGVRETSTQVLTRVNDHTASWKSVDRSSNGRNLPDVEEIFMVKTPPKPQ